MYVLFVSIFYKKLIDYFINDKLLHKIIDNKNKMRRIPLIGISGIKKSGKDTSANFLIERYGLVKKSFAEPLKKACKELFYLSDTQLYGSQEEKEAPDEIWFGCSARKILQFVGTDLLRDQLNKIMPELGEDIFVYNFKLWYENELKNKNTPHIIISDVRFQNEVDYIKKLGGIIIRINRPEVESNDMHPSEIQIKNLIGVDYDVDNSNTLNMLYQEINHIYAVNYLL